METQVAVYQAHELDFTRVVVFQQFEDGRLRVFMPIAQQDGSVVWDWQEVAEGEAPPPTFLIPRVLNTQANLLQQLADRLAENGIWPKEMKGQSEVIGRLEAHLDDFRRLVFEGDWVELQRGRPQAQLVQEKESEDAKV